MNEQQNCTDCSFRKKYDDDPRSILGKIWKWHTGWCPGWKKYMETLDSDERNAIAERYNMTKYLIQ